MVGDVDMVKSCLAADSGLLSSRFRDGKNILILAVERRNYELVSFLLDEFVYNDSLFVNSFDHIGNNALFYLVNNFDINIFNKLIENGIDINNLNHLGQSFLGLAYDKFDGAIELLLKNGASIYCVNDQQRRDIINRCFVKYKKDDQIQIQDYILLVPQRNGTQYYEKIFNLYLAICVRDDEYLEKTLQDFNEIQYEDLRVFFLYCVYNNFYHSASKIFEKFVINDKDVRQQNLLDVDSIDIEYDDIMDLVGFDFGRISKFIICVKNLMEDSECCFNYLAEIDNAIFAKFGDVFKDTARLTQYFAVEGLLWPKYRDDFVEINKEKFLINFIRDRLREHEIDDQDYQIKFFEYVMPKQSSEVINCGSLFQEQFLGGASLIHGVNSHYLQFYLIARALEDNYQGMAECQVSLRDFMDFVIDHKISNQVGWNYLIDHVFADNLQKQDFGAVFSLNSFILSNNYHELRNLRGYMLNAFFKKLDKIYDVCCGKEFDFIGLIDKDRFLDILVASNVAARGSFNIQNLNIGIEDVVKYYEDKGYKVDTVRSITDFDGDGIGIVAKKPLANSDLRKGFIVLKGSKALKDNIRNSDLSNQIS